MTKKLTLPLMSLFLAAMMPAVASAQGFYDDDIYDTGKSKPAKTKTVTKKSTTKANSQTYIPSLSGTGYYYGGDGNIYQEYNSADSYNFNSGNMRDVDEYNRRGFFAKGQVDSIPADSLADFFAYTRRIEKYHNPDVVSGSKDADLQAYYYDSQNQTPQVNVYLNSYPYYSPWGWNSYYSYGPSWSFSWGYRPWSWGWNWNWGWGYDPFWDWGWAGPSWGPAWGPGWGPGWGGPVWGWAPPARPYYNTGIGSSGVHRPVGGTRPGSGTIHAGRPSGGTGGFGVRPGASGTRPGSSVSNIGGVNSNRNFGTRPGASQTRPGYQQNHRPAGTVINSNGTGSRPGVYNRPANNNQNNNSIYSRPSGGGSRPSGSSIGSGGGSRPTRSTGGGGGSRGSRR